MKTLEKTCANLIINEFRGMCNSHGVSVWESGISATDMGLLAWLSQAGYRREVLAILKWKMNQIHGERA